MKLIQTGIIRQGFTGPGIKGRGKLRWMEGRGGEFESSTPEMQRQE